ncbi:GNAT family N-acetyltransferase [Sulfitobacter sp. HNIBRBA2951]|uniref:GNAT family N-acetyltransferase n=1 Tax=Sulfitobacter aquimarinus TaxID=3158557 RepID=UPI0032DE500B
MAEFTLHAADTPQDIADVVALCWAYRKLLLSLPDVSREVTSAFHPDAKYAELMDSLPILHARPKGVIMLARDAEGTPLGCGMSHPLDPTTSEIKRVFVTADARGKGVAEAICTALVDQARTDGFARAVLDTHITLHPARRLYARLGFTQRGPYQEMPAEVLPELVFFEKPLHPQSLRLELPQ